MKLSVFLLIALAWCFLVSHYQVNAQYLFEEYDSIFTPNDLNHGEIVHMPSIIVTQNGTVIASTQIRLQSHRDWGHDSAIILRRSNDGGRSWEPVSFVYSEEGTNAINGPIVEDKVSGEIIYPFTRLPSEMNSQAEWVRHNVYSGGSLSLMRSKDEGLTWSDVKEFKPISQQNLVAWPSNSSHGIQLSSGRLIIGAFIAEKKAADHEYLESEYAAGLIYSDDHGDSWYIGARIPYNGSDEIAVLETNQGELYVNFRINNRNPRDLVRGFARSRDGGESFYEVGLQDNLSKTGCHIGLVKYSKNDNRNILLYSGPYGTGNMMTPGHDRYNLILRASFDQGKTWPIAQNLDTGYAGYSDLAVTGDGAILCLYGVDTFVKESISRIKLIRLSWDAVENVYISRKKNLN